MAVTTPVKSTTVAKQSAPTAPAMETVLSHPSGTAELQVQDEFFECKRADEILAHLRGLTLIRNPPFMIFGKPAVMHRSIGFFSNTSAGYRFSGQIAPAQPLTPELDEILEEVNGVFETNFNAILVNIYHDSADYIGAHSDDESALAKDGLVVGISLGSPRTFRIRDKAKKSIVLDVPTKHGQMIAMRGAFQRLYTHEVLKGAGLRASMTFRRHTS